MKRGHKEVVEMLVSHGADLNTPIFGYPPLIWTAINGITGVAEVLISHGAMIDIACEDETPLLKVNKEMYCGVPVDALVGVESLTFS